MFKLIIPCSLEVSITKSEVINDRLIIKYEIGEYWRENSYNYGRSDIISQIELDMAKFVKSVARATFSKKYSGEQVQEHIGSYSLN